MAYSHMAAAELAKLHFNARDSQVVEELSDELYSYQNCDVSLQEFYRDSHNSAATSLSALLQVDQQVDVCAVLGPNNLRAMQVLSGFTEVKQIPLLVNEPTSPSLDFTSVVSTRYPLRYLARAMAEYCHLYMAPARDYVIIMYDNEHFDGPFQERLEDEFDQEASGEWLIGEEDAIQDAVGEVLDEGYNTIIIDTNDFELLSKLADEAEKEGLFERPILWIIASKTIPAQVLNHLELDIGSPLDLLLTGAAVYADSDPFLMNPNMSQHDKFLASWRQQNETLVHRLNELHPLRDDHSTYFTPQDDYFQITQPATYASFVYDTVMLTGMSACRMQAQAKAQADNLTNSQSLYLDEGPHLGQMLKTSFHGASGHFQFGDPPALQEEEESSSSSSSGSGSSSTEEDESEEEEPKPTKKRSPVGAQYGLYNIRSKPSGEGKHRYYTVLTSTYKNGEWTEVEGEQFIYSDGTVNPLQPVRLSFEDNYLDEKVSIVGLALMALALAISIGTALWVFVQQRKQNRLIVASQPQFLYMMSVGSALVASTIAFVSFDESMGYTEEKLSAFCQAAPWFFVVGYIIIYCSLVGKLWRINKLLSNTVMRKQILVHQALWPFVFLFACIIILICWQTIDPFVWERTEINDEPLETFGKCTSENVTPYVASLGCLIFMATGLTLHISWKTKGVQDSLAETKWIFAGVFSHLQLWVVGIPTFIILNDESAQSAYMIKACLAFLFSTVMIVVVIWPKIWVIHFKKEESKPRSRINRRRWKRSCPCLGTRDNQ